MHSLKKINYMHPYWYSNQPCSSKHDSKNEENIHTNYFKEGDHSHIEYIFTGSAKDLVI